MFWFFVAAGKTSRLNSVSGTQNEWITSLELTRNRTFSFCGTTSTGISSGRADRVDGLAGPRVLAVADARQELERRAAEIADPGLRTSFLGNVSIHRELIAAAARLER